MAHLDGSLRPKRIEVPGLDMHAAKSTRRADPKAQSDEVQAILDGLRLDKKFFGRFLDKDILEDLAPQHKEDGEKGGDKSPPSPGPKMVAKKSLGIGKNRTKRMERTLNRSKTTLDEWTALANRKRTMDFDIYLGEALLPVLAQSMDALCRQRNRMDEQGDRLDPKVRARFNPLTFLAQQLLRRHPKYATTPRRSHIHRNFSDWADQERGRREILRRQDIIEQCFGGFVLRGAVSESTIPHVISAIDDTLYLGGALKEHPEIVALFNPDGTTNFKSVSAKKRSQLFRDAPWNWERFWHEFSGAILNFDVVRNSMIQKGMELKKEAVLLAAERQQAEEREQEWKRQKAELQRRLIARYTELHQLLQEDAHIRTILDGSHILTGDDVRPGDAGYEYEVPPKGHHVTLLAELLKLLGFDKLTLPGVDQDGIIAVEEGAEMWWDNELAAAWTVIQELQNSLKDGVVEKDVLEQVLVPPVGFIVLRHKVEDELERQQDPLMEGDRDEGHMGDFGGGAVKKPTFDELCLKLGMTMSRVQWLHALFETFLPHEPGSDVHPTDHYPDDPAAIPKVAMRELIREMHPHLTDSEFEARFARIDSDGSGVIEFDEFINWVREDEVHVVGGQKMTFGELAHHLNEGVGLIRYLYRCWCDQMTMMDQEAEVDDYPNNPKSMAKKDVRELLKILTPTVTDEDFELEFSQVDTLSKGNIDFDEFLEVLDQEAIAPEIRESVGQTDG